MYHHKDNAVLWDYRPSLGLYFIVDCFVFIIVALGLLSTHMPCNNNYECVWKRTNCK